MQLGFQTNDCWAIWVKRHNSIILFIFLEYIANLKIQKESLYMDGLLKIIALNENQAQLQSYAFLLESKPCELSETYFWTSMQKIACKATTLNALIWSK